MESIALAVLVTVAIVGSLLAWRRVLTRSKAGRDFIDFG
jgi:hypothetical protein